MTENLLNSGLVLTLFGMGTVFVFLVLLIFATRAMSWLALKLDAPMQTPHSPGVSPAGTPAQPAEAELVAVISAAVQQHRRAKSAN